MIGDLFSATFFNSLRFMTSCWIYAVCFQKLLLHDCLLDLCHVFPTAVSYDAYGFLISAMFSDWLFHAWLFVFSHV